MGFPFGLGSTDAQSAHQDQAGHEIECGDDEAVDQGGHHSALRAIGAPALAGKASHQHGLSLPTGCRQ